MPSASAADNPNRDLPPELEQDHQAFTAELKRIARGPDSPLPVRELLEDEEALEKLIRLAVLLYHHSNRLALVARGDRPRILTRHILDSLNPLSLFGHTPASVLDVGSGAGLPGIPLAVVWPDTEITLLESREKKAGFLERAVREVRCANARVVCARLEEAGTAWRTEPFEAIMVRGVGGLRQVLNAASRVAAPGATWTYFLGNAARADAVVPTLEPLTHHPTLRQGATGGWLLTGRFATSRP